LVKWSPVSAASGYKVYVRQGSTYGTGLDVGALAPQGDGAVHFVVAGLPAGQQSFFAVTAYGATGLESVLSNEQSVLVSATSTPTRTWTPTATPTRTWTPTSTPTRTNTPASTSTATAQATSTATSPPTATATVPPTATATPRKKKVRGRINYYSTDAAVGGARVLLQGTETSISTSTDAAGEFAFDNIDGEHWTIEPEDVELPTTGITALDVSYALQAAGRLRVLTEEQAIACDVTGNGAVSALDAALILQNRLGMLPRFPVAEVCESDWLFVPVPSIVPNQTVTAPHATRTTCQRGSIDINPLADDAMAQDFRAVRLGDCTGDEVVADTVSAGLDILASSTVPDQFELKLYVSSDAPVEGVDALLSFDQDRLKVVAASAAMDGVQHIAGVNSENPGAVAATLAAAEPASELQQPVLSVVVEGQVSAAELRQMIEPSIFVNDVPAETSVSIEPRHRGRRVRRPARGLVKQQLIRSQRSRPAPRS
jgi:hypothetical protein